MAQDNAPKKSMNSGVPGLELTGTQSAGFQVVRPGQPVMQSSPPPEVMVQNGAPRPAAQGNPASGQSPAYVVAALGSEVDDEISTFFRNRQMIAQGAFGTSPLVRLVSLVLVFLGGFITAWNYVEPVRSKSQNFIAESFDVRISDFIPVWTKKSKAFQKHAAMESTEASQRDGADLAGGASSGGSLDPLHLAVISGLWPQVESYNASHCPRWQSTRECGVRAFYLAYREMRPSLKPLQMLDISAQSGLSARDQALFLFAKSAAVTGPQSEQIFMEAIGVAGKDKLITRVIFDARFKALLRENRPKEIISMIRLLDRLSIGAPDIAKWKALELSSRWVLQIDAPKPALQALASKQISLALRKYPGLFKADPVGFIMIAGPALRLGLSTPISQLSGMMVTESARLQFDPTLRRELSKVFARTMLLGGQPAAAAERLLAAQKQDGSDAVTTHLLGSAFLEERSAPKAAEAARLFQVAFKSSRAWQSGYGYFTALIRSGRLAEAGKLVGALRHLRVTSNEIWIDIGLAEYNLAFAKSAGEGATARYREVANALSGSYVRHPEWPTLARLYGDALAGAGQGAEAAKIRSKMDDVSSKTSYLLSPELAESPIGPLAVLK